MHSKSQIIKIFMRDLRDLADKELAIRARRKQLFDKLVAECDDTTEGYRLGRVAFYRVEREALQKRIEKDLEFLFDDVGGMQDDDLDESGAN